MAAIPTHVVYVKPTNVDALGNVVLKDSPSTTIKQMMGTNTEMRIVPDISAPNSATSPSIQAYIYAEAALGYKVMYIDNTIIVTQLF